jgi:hypothetical protein
MASQRQGSWIAGCGMLLAALAILLTPAAQANAPAPGQKTPDHKPAAKADHKKADHDKATDHAKEALARAKAAHHSHGMHGLEEAIEHLLAVIEEKEEAHKHHHHHKHHHGLEAGLMAMVLELEEQGPLAQGFSAATKKASKAPSKGQQQEAKKKSASSKVGDKCGEGKKAGKTAAKSKSKPGSSVGTNSAKKTTAKKGKSGPGSCVGKAKSGGKGKSGKGKPSFAFDKKHKGSAVSKGAKEAGKAHHCKGHKLGSAVGTHKHKKKEPKKNEVASKGGKDGKEGKHESPVHHHPAFHPGQVGAKGSHGHGKKG